MGILYIFPYILHYTALSLDDYATTKRAKQPRLIPRIVTEGWRGFVMLEILLFGYPTYTAPMQRMDDDN